MRYVSWSFQVILFDSNHISSQCHQSQTRYHSYRQLQSRFVKANCSVSIAPIASPAHVANPKPDTVPIVNSNHTFIKANCCISIAKQFWHEWELRVGLRQGVQHLVSSVPAQVLCFPTSPTPQFSTGNMWRILGQACFGLQKRTMSFLLPSAGHSYD